MKEIIETPHLLLKAMSDEDYESILRNATDAEVVHNFGIRPGEVEKERQKAIKGFSTYNKSMLIFQLAEKNSGRIIGWCGFHTWYRDHNRAELGYILFDDVDKGRGYMMEAVLPVVAYGFETMGLNRIEAFVGPDNIPSLKILQKMKFTREGYLRKHYYRNGIYENSVLFSLLAEEYFEMQKEIEINQA